MVRSALAVVIPCHNEAATLGKVVRAAARYGDIIVVDDRSADGSRLVAEAAGAQVIASAAPGYDGALETGLRQAMAVGYKFVVTMDADGEHDPELLSQFLRAFEGGADLICGARPRRQRAAEHLVGALGVALFQIQDLLCGMKGYSRRLLEAYVESGSPLATNMAPAMLWRRSGGDCVQIKVTGQERLDAPRFGSALRANWAILSAFASALAHQPPSSRRKRPVQ